MSPVTVFIKPFSQLRGRSALRKLQGMDCSSARQCYRVWFILQLWTSWLPCECRVEPKIAGHSHLFSCHSNYTVVKWAQVVTALLLSVHSVLLCKGCNCNKFSGAQQQKLQYPLWIRSQVKNTAMLMILLSSCRLWKRDFVFSNDLRFHDVIYVIQKNLCKISHSQQNPLLKCYQYSDDQIWSHPHFLPSHASQSPESWRRCFI